MLSSFKFENWMSYRDENKFSMIASEGDQHSGRIQKSTETDLSLLPIAAILGGNASGKSNFVKALNFAQEFILYGNFRGNGIPCDCFLMDEKYESAPTRFTFELLIDDTAYIYEFSATSKRVISESLSEFNENNIKLIYKIENNSIKIDDNYEHRNIFNEFIKIKKEDELFLTTIHRVSNIKLPVYFWFRDNLTIFFPTTNFNRSRLFTDELLLQTVNNALETLDCGASKIDFVDYSPSEVELENFKNQLERRQVAFDRNSLVIAQKINGEIKTKKFVSFHKNDNGELVRFDLKKESDGTLRIFDLLPAISSLTKSGSSKLCVIDEIELSLHTHLIQDLIRAYLDNCNVDTKSQLIFTTHNVLLMDESNLRFDEMWLTKRSKDGSSTIYSIDDFEDAKFEKSIRHSYLIGRFGGIPDMLLNESQIKLPDKMENSENKS